MKLIRPSVEIRVQEAGKEGMLRHIEWAGRHCYKSHDKITPDSASRFVSNITKSGHGSVLEHGTIYLSVTDLDIAAKYVANPYSKVTPCAKGWWAVTTNYRVIVENDWDMDLMYECEPTPHHERRITAKFVCNRRISHEFVRHRKGSFSQESTRYCNYSKGKFGSQITYIKPSWWDVAPEERENFLEGLLKAEEVYLSALKRWEERKPDKRFRTGFKGNPLSPQMASDILPMDLKTELIMTEFESDWNHFFELRCSTAAHPDARYLANKLKSLITKD